MAHRSERFEVSEPAIMLRLTLRSSPSVSPLLSGSLRTFPWMLPPVLASYNLCPPSTLAYHGLSTPSSISFLRFCWRAA